MPTGGVNSPMARLIITMTPNQTGSQPSWRITGRKIGRQMNMMVIASMNMPATSKISMMIPRITHSLSESPSSAPEYLPTRSSTVMTQPNRPA